MTSTQLRERPVAKQESELILNRELDHALRQWEAALRQRSVDRERSASAFSKLMEKLVQWFVKERKAKHREEELLGQILHMRDALKHGSQEHIDESIAPLFDEIKKLYAEEIQLSAESMTLLSTEDEYARERFEMVVAGKAKKRTDIDAAPNQLGNFGQDVARANRATGTIVIADGVSSVKDSFEAARIASFTAAHILDTIPENVTSSASSVQEWVRGRITDIIHSLDILKEKNGATTLLAMRYLESLDMLIVVDLGDCQYTLVANNTVIIPIQQRPEHNNQPAMIKHTSGKTELANTKTDLVNKMITMINIKELRAKYPDAAFTLVAASDGIENTTGKSIEVHATGLCSAKNVNDYLETIPTTKKPDDLSCVIMRISSPS